MLSVAPFSQWCVLFRSFAISTTQCTSHVSPLTLYHVGEPRDDDQRSRGNDPQIWSHVPKVRIPHPLTFRLLKLTLPPPLHLLPCLCLVLPTGLPLSISVSAASQAITTYIRNHMARCEAQEDHPLLLRHVLSGTLADDDLVPALHSRIGGATIPTKPCSKDLGLNDKNMAQTTLEGERLTNFRRGTMVWYLSKAAGVSCPFARAGIRLCEYGKEGRNVADKHGDELQPRPKNQPSRDEAQCGDKRKRLRRGCRRGSDRSRESSSIGRDSPAIDSGYGELGADSSDDERPPKVKLTLRLRPSLPCTPKSAAVPRPREVIDLSNDTSGSSSEDSAASADDGDDADIHPDPPEAPWSLPPYPRRSISVPHYTPSCDERVSSPSFLTHHGAITNNRRRSPSVPCSASPPPDSDHDDFDLDSDLDWDSSSLSAPSPAPALQVKVETTDGLQLFKPAADIRDMLDAWEDLDCSQTSTVSSATVKLPATDDPKFDALELWEWEFESSWTGTEDHQDLPVVKMELDETQFLPSLQAFAPVFPVSPYSPFTPSSHHSTSSPLSEMGADSLASQSPLSPFTLPSSSSSLPLEVDRGSCSLTWQDAELLGPDSVHPHEFEGEWASGVRLHVDCNLLPQRASDVAVSSPLSVGSEQRGPDDTCAVVNETDCCRESRVHPSHSSSLVEPDPVVVRTCRPCSPDICATQIEGTQCRYLGISRDMLTGFAPQASPYTRLCLDRPFS